MTTVGFSVDPREFSPEVQQWIQTRPDEVHAMLQFLRLMMVEFAENSGKGDRPGWLTMTPERALSEVHHHVAKLHVATVEATRRARGKEPRELPWPEHEDALDWVREYAADTAGCCLMLLDVLSGLPGMPRGIPGAQFDHPIVAGQTYVWEPQEPLARRDIKVTGTELRGDELWVKSIGEDEAEHWNPESRFREAAVPT
jgi:hypothetical protein